RVKKISSRRNNFRMTTATGENGKSTAGTESANSLLTVKGLCKSYRGRKVVDDVALHVGSGEIVGLLGPNGAGKTTCFNMVVGLVRPDAGEVNFLEQEVTQLPMHRRARLGIGYLTQ